MWRVWQALHAKELCKEFPINFNWHNINKSDSTTQLNSNFKLNLKREEYKINTNTNPVQMFGAMGRAIVAHFCSSACFLYVLLVFDVHILFTNTYIYTYTRIAVISFENVHILIRKFFQQPYILGTSACPTCSGECENVAQRHRPLINLKLLSPFYNKCRRTCIYVHTIV